MAPHDPDDERWPSGPPLPPEDRLWRHPSELGRAAHGPVGGVPSGGAAPAASIAAAPTPIQRTSRVAALTGACLAGALVTLGVLLLTRPMPDDDVRRAGVVGRVNTTLAVGPSATAPLASAARPIRNAAAVSVATTALSGAPGKLRVQVADGEGSAVVVSVSADGPAHRAGLAAGDHIVAVDQTAVTHSNDLSWLLATTRPGDVITLSVLREGTGFEVSVTLE